MRKIVLTFGFIGGAILSAFLVAPFVFMKPGEIPHSYTYGYATMVLSMLLIYFGVRQYRDTVSGGSVGFWKALQVGLLIFVVVGVCYVITWEILYRTVASGFMADYAQHAIAQARASGASEAVIAAQQADMDKFATMYANPFFRAAVTFLEPLPVGVVLSLVTAWLMSRRSGAAQPKAA